jgi:glutathione S-transferase
LGDAAREAIAHAIPARCAGRPATPGLASMDSASAAEVQRAAARRNAMSAAVLHQWEISPFCGKVRKVLQHKGIAFSVVNYNGLRASKAAALSPAGKLPVLDIDGQRLQDSTAIVRFLESRFPADTLLPDDPAQRALALLLEDWADESLYWFEIALRMGDKAVLPKAAELLSFGRPAWERAVVRTVLQVSMPKKLKAQGLGCLPRERVHELLFEHLDSIEALLARNPWLVGPAKSIADIAVSSQLDEMIRTSPLAPRMLAYPGIKDWLARCA